MSGERQKLRLKTRKDPAGAGGLRSGGIQEDYRKLESHYGWQRQGWASQEDSPLQDRQREATGKEGQEGSDIATNPLQSDLRGSDLPNDLLTGQHGDDAQEGGDLFTGEREEGGNESHEGLGGCHEPGGMDVLHKG